MLRVVYCFNNKYLITNILQLTNFKKINKLRNIFYTFT